MKKISFIITIICTGVIISCNNEAQKINQNDLILGKWKLHSTVYYTFSEKKVTDYIDKEIIYDFKDDGRLLIKNRNNINSIEMLNYSIRQEMVNDRNNIYIIADGTEYFSIINGDTLKLSSAHFDGFTEILLRE